MKYRIEIKRASFLSTSGEKHTSYVRYPYNTIKDLTSYKHEAYQFDLEEAQRYTDYNKLDGDVMIIPIPQYHIMFDGHYVSECDCEYLVACEKQDSIFNEDIAMSLKKQCPDRIRLEEIMNEDLLKEEVVVEVNTSDVDWVVESYDLSHLDEEEQQAECSRIIAEYISKN